ncbi:MAG: hypothetical protein NTV58_10900 [Deltaproteobacteria bacterium]|nr:hypothetical protein [Deltaproteobacteria bacterium]
MVNQPFQVPIYCSRITNIFPQGMFHSRRCGIVPAATADIAVMSDKDKTGEWAVASLVFIKAGKDRP